MTRAARTLVGQVFSTFGFLRVLSLTRTGDVPLRDNANVCIASGDRCDNSIPLFLGCAVKSALKIGSKNQYPFYRGDGVETGAQRCSKCDELLLVLFVMVRINS